MGAPRKSIGSNQTRGFRLISTTPITQDNQQWNVDLPRGPHIEAAIIRVTGTIQVTVAFAGGVRSIAPYLFLRRVDWVLNSNVTLDSISGAQLYQLYVTRRQYPVSVAPTAGIAAGIPFDATWILDRALMDMMRPKDSMLKTDVGVSNNQLRIQFGQLSDMYGNGAGTAVYTAVTASVSVVDYQEARTNGDTPAPLYYVKRNGLRVALPAAGNGQQVKINTGNRLRMISVRVLDGTTLDPSATGPSTLMSRVRVQRAGDTRVDITTNELLRLNQAAYGVALALGQVVVDFAYTGQLGVRYSEFWPIPSSADTYLLVDTTASSILEIATIEGVDLVS